MKSRIIFLVLFIYALSPTAFGQQAKLDGYVLDEKDRPISATRIIVPSGQAGVTDSKGHFTISFAESVQPGQATRITIVKTNWVIYQPLFGNCVTQSRERNYEPLRVVIVPRASPLALSPKRLSEVIRQWSAERVKLRTEVGRLQESVDEDVFLRQYAKEYGLTLEQFRLAVEQWAQIKDSDDKEERALKEYWLKNYSKAAQLAHESARTADEELEQANKKTIEASLKVIRRYKLEGNAYSAQHKFREALNAYLQIAQRFEERALSKETFRAQWESIRILVAIAKANLGVSVEAEEGRRLLNESLAELQEIGTFYTREQSPREWAVTQLNLGIVLWNIGSRVSGPEAMKYLKDAIAASRTALEVQTRNESPQDWAAMQNNLGVELQSCGELISGPEAMKYLEGAEAAYRAALEVYTRAQSPQDWAMTQNNLGSVLQILGERLNGPEDMKYLKDAEVAYRAALEVRTREQLPQDWAATQNNLGSVLRSLGERVGGPEDMKYLKDAEVAYRAALEVRTREQLPQDWAMTQNNLGAVQLSLGERLSGPEDMKYLKDAEATYRAALEVRTREQLPQDWAMTQNNLGVVLEILSERVNEAESGKYLKDAITAYRAALGVRTREQLPRQWATTQYNLGIAYSQLHDWSGAEEAYTNVLAFDPNHKDAYYRMASLFHETLFKFDKAFVLHEKWLALHPEDTSAQIDFAEAHFTVGRFKECQQRINSLLTLSAIPIKTKTALRAIEIASLLADNKASQVPVNLDALIAEVASQPSLRVTWNFSGTRHYIEQYEKLLPYRLWLEQLFDSLASDDRDTMLKALENVRRNFKEKR